MNTRNYTQHTGMTPDYHAVRQFLIEPGDCEFTYARWDWMITHSYLDQSALTKIRLWEDEGRLVAIATYDTRLGTAYCLTFPEYADLKREMLVYAQTHLATPEEFNVVIPNQDIDFQKIAHDLGYVATRDAEHDAVFYLPYANLEYTLPEGFTIVSMKDRYDPFEYRRVLWKGFNHELNGEGSFTFTDEDRKGVDFEMIRENIDLSLKLAVVDPEGHFVSYCGLWFDAKAGFALIEPLATDPEFRGKGLAKAVVLEGVRRVKEQGATRVFVGSNQQFYYKIGMFPYRESAIWKKFTVSD